MGLCQNSIEHKEPQRWIGQIWDPHIFIAPFYLHACRNRNNAFWKRSCVSLDECLIINCVIVIPWVTHESHDQIINTVVHIFIETDRQHSGLCDIICLRHHLRSEQVWKLLYVSKETHISLASAFTYTRGSLDLFFQQINACRSVKAMRLPNGHHNTF